MSPAPRHLPAARRGRPTHPALRAGLGVGLAAFAVAFAGCRAARPPPPPVVVAPAPPDPAETLAGATALRAAGDVDGARRALEDGLDEAGPAPGPGWDPVRLEYADLVVAQGGDPARARAALDAAADRDARRWLVLSGAVNELAGDDAGAARDYGRALAAGVGPEDADLQLHRALALERAGQDALATAELERLLQGGADPVVRSRLAVRYEAAGRLAEAEAQLVALAKAPPPRAAAWDRLAGFYERIGKPGKARSARARAKALAGGRSRVLRPLLPSAR